MNRREVLIGSGALLSTVFAEQALGDDQEAHEHSAHGTKKYATLIDAGLDCAKKSEACIQHCVHYFGDITFEQCAARVQEMLPVCTALSHLASNESRHLKKFIAACIEVCADCEKECNKHNEHPECKACADACAHCIKVCKEVLAA